MEAYSKGRFAEASPSDSGITTTVSRSELEQTLSSSEGPALLVLDIATRGGESETGDVEAHTLEVELEKPDLEQILRTASGDAIELRFDPTELAQALEEGDVDAHGLRQKALILSVAAATAAGVAGQASAMQAADGGGSVTASAPASAALKGGPEWPRAAAVEAESAPVSSEALAGGAEWPRAAAAASTAEPTELASEALAGGAEWPRAAAAASTSEPTELATEALAGGPEWPRAAAGTGDAFALTPAGGGGGITISSSDATAAGIGGLLLLITGASFAAARRQQPPAQA